MRQKRFSFSRLIAMTALAVATGIAAYLTITIVWPPESPPSAGLTGLLRSIMIVTGLYGSLALTLCPAAKRRYVDADRYPAATLTTRNR